MNIILKLLLSCVLLFGAFLAYAAAIDDTTDNSKIKRLIEKLFPIGLSLFFLSALGTLLAFIWGL